MIAPPSGVRVWLATGVTDMRRGMNGLALQVQQALQRDPHSGDLYVFRGRRGDLLKSCGMTGSACRFTRSGWNAAASSGPRRWTVSLQSRRHSWVICSKELTGEIPNERGGRRQQDSAESNAAVGKFVVPRGGKM